MLKISVRMLKNILKPLKKCAQHLSFVVLMTCFIACSSSKIPERQKQLDELTRDLEKILALESVEIRGKGRGSRNDKYHRIGYLFGITVEKSSQEVVREKLVTIYELVLQEINKRETLKPYLEQVPFPIEELDLVFVFNHPDGSFPKDPEILSAFVVRGEIFYNIQAPEQKYGFSREIIEPYEEAKAKVLGLPTSS